MQAIKAKRRTQDISFFGRYSPDTETPWGLGARGPNTDPLSADSDFDGLSDGAEVNIHKSDPLDKDSAREVPLVAAIRCAGRRSNIFCCWVPNRFEPV